MLYTDTFLCIVDSHEYFILGERYTCRHMPNVTSVYGNMKHGKTAIYTQSYKLDRILIDNFVTDVGYSDKDIFQLKMTGELP